MKAVFKNKKILSLSIFSLAIVLSFIIIIPKVLALNNSGGDIVKKQKDEVSSQETILSEVAANVVTETTDDNSPKVQEINNNQVNDTPKTDDKNDVSNPTTENNIEVQEPTLDNIPETVIDENFIKINSDVVEIGNIKFKFNSVNEDDSLFQTTTKIYLSEDRDSVVLDAKTNTIYEIYLMPESVTKNVIKAKSKSDADLKATADKLASKFCKDIGRYNTYHINYDDVSECYYVNYRLTVNGYNTSEYMSFAFDSNLNFLNYYCKPNIFDGIDVSNLVIDEKAIIEQINKASLARFGESFGHNEIIAMTLTVKDSKLIMCVEYIEYDKDGKPLVKNGIATNDIEIK